MFWKYEEKLETRAPKGRSPLIPFLQSIIIIHLSFPFLFLFLLIGRSEYIKHTSVLLLEYEYVNQIKPSLTSLLSYYCREEKV
jgi:hypothetical protein